MKFDIIDLDTIKKSTRTITGIVIHHSASRDGVSARNIDEWHKSRSWKGIGYHYVVRHNGPIQEGRDININGAHTKGRNKNTIGICVSGNFSENNPLDRKYRDQMIAVANLVNRLRDIYGVECKHGRFLDDRLRTLNGWSVCPDCNGTGTIDIPVTGHREHNATECPGMKVDLDQMRKFFDYMRTVT